MTYVFQGCVLVPEGARAAISNNLKIVSFVIGVLVNALTDIREVIASAAVSVFINTFDFS
jgi:hypothetical protein